MKKCHCEKDPCKIWMCCLLPSSRCPCVLRDEAERREEEAGEEATVAERERCEERAALETR